ncbi:hypothetical protein PAUR_a1489 [Pseudoalteromonas aurantia 208]|uniref:Uncharacterized protein n=1 Tax=Pseudoalteromonas aurantia 208 TaxID=1314867 RepID=A0ABR9EAJ4_9GAMM|nr:hypothetical protein [Pseudoalteromonas aurantia 208]
MNALVLFRGNPSVKKPANNMKRHCTGLFWETILICIEFYSGYELLL